MYPGAANLSTHNATLMPGEIGKTSGFAEWMPIAIAGRVAVGDQKSEFPRKDVVLDRYFRIDAILFRTPRKGTMR
jgi:hypothetical protein